MVVSNRAMARTNSHACMRRKPTGPGGSLARGVTGGSTWVVMSAVLLVAGAAGLLDGLECARQRLATAVGKPRTRVVERGGQRSRVCPEAGVHIGERLRD